MTVDQSARTDAESFSSSVVLEQTAAAPESLLASPDQLTQGEITQEIIDVHAAAARREEAGEKLSISLHDFRPYRSSVLRHPTKNPRLVDPETIELCVARRSASAMSPRSSPISRSSTWASPWASGSRCRGGCSTRGAGRSRTSSSRSGRRTPRALHPPARPASRPARPELHRGRPHGHRRRRRVLLHDDQAGRRTRGRTTSTRGAPPTSTSPCSAPASRSASSPRCTSPAIRSSPLDPIYNTIWRQEDRDRLIGVYDHDLSVPEFSMGYRFDIVVDGPDATWFEPEGEH